MTCDEREDTLKKYKFAFFFMKDAEGERERWSLCNIVRLVLNKNDK